MLCMLMRLLEKPVTRFLDMVEVTAADADGLYKATKESIEEKLIPLTNVIGFSSDMCNVCDAV